MAATLAKKTGGWTSNEAIAYGIGMDAAFKRIGLSSDNFVPSVESFGGEGRARIDATASVENHLKDALVSVWEAIKRAIGRVIAFVRKWYTKIFDGASRLKRRAQAISKKAQNTTGSIKENKIRVAGYSSLHVNKTIPTGADLAKVIAGYGTLLESLSEKAMGKDYNNLTDALATSVSDLGTGTGDVTTAELNAIVSAVDGTAMQTIKFPSDFGGSSSADNAKVFATAEGSSPAAFKTKELPGGVCLVVLNLGATKLAAGEDAATMSSKAKYNLRHMGKIVLVDAAAKKVELDTSKEFKTLDQGEVTRIADAVVDVCDKIIDYKLGFDNYEKHNSKLINKIDNVVRKANNSDDADGRARNQVTRDIATGVGSVVRNRATTMSTVIELTLRTSRASLAYGLQSLGQYKD